MKGPTFVRMKAANLSSTYHGDILASAQKARWVELWHVGQAQRIHKVETTLNGYRNGIALYPDQSRVAVVSYQESGVAAFEAESGKELWRRSDLTQVGTVRCSFDGKRLYCTADRRGLIVLNAETGRTRTSPTGIRRLTESPFDDAMLLLRKTGSYQIKSFDFKSMTTIERKSRFGGAVTGFAPGRVCIREQNILRCCDLKSGKQIWELDLGESRMAMSINFVKANEEFAIVHQSSQEAADMRLTHVAAESGTIRGSATELSGAGTYVFTNSGSFLISIHGDVYDAVSGELSHRLDFFN